MAYSNTEKRRLWARDHYAKNPDKVKQINKVKREKRKSILFEHLGNKCCKCGSTTKLELDHINPLSHGETLKELVEPIHINSFIYKK